MKYVRTKDGRILTFTPKKKYENDKSTFDWFVANYCGGGINVLKVTDTIEELCDVYVIKDRDERLPFVSNTDFDYSNNKDKNNFDVYGAIWVGVDLKSIAKMNDKGELELL